jgi:hypothetical protein
MLLPGPPASDSRPSSLLRTTDHHAPSSPSSTLSFQFFVQPARGIPASRYYVLIILCFLDFLCSLVRFRHPEQGPSRTRNVALPRRRTWQDDCHGRADAGATRAWDHHWQGHLEGQSAARLVCVQYLTTPSLDMSFSAPESH